MPECVRAGGFYRRPGYYAATDERGRWLIGSHIIMMWLSNTNYIILLTPALMSQSDIVMWAVLENATFSVQSAATLPTQSSSQRTAKNPHRGLMSKQTHSSEYKHLHKCARTHIGNLKGNGSV